MVLEDRNPTCDRTYLWNRKENIGVTILEDRKVKEKAKESLPIMNSLKTRKKDNRKLK